MQIFFIADAISMYTNIDTNHSIEIVEKWLVIVKQEKNYAKTSQ